LSMTEDATIRIDQTTLQSVYTYIQLGMAPDGDQPTEPTLPCELSVVTVPSCNQPSKQFPPPRRNCTKTVKCPHVATRETHWEGGLTPTSAPLIPSILLAVMSPHFLSSTRP
jgi:hypothetical protein